MQRPPPPPPHHKMVNVPPLPPGWIEYRAQGGQPYWYNTFTRQSTWQRPFAPAAPPPPPPQPSSTIQSKATTTNNNEPTSKLKKSRQKIPGTNWLLVTTDDGIEFYYNKDTKSSVWEMPPELEEPIKKMKQEIFDAQKSSSNSAEKRKLTEDVEEKEKEEEKPIDDNNNESKKQKLEQQSEPQPESAEPAESTEMTEEDIMWQMENMDPEELEALGLANQEEEEERGNDEHQQQILNNQSAADHQTPAGNNVDGHKNEINNDESQQSNEEKIEQFTQMLTEKDISPFSTWEKELPKLISDPRYHLVQPHSKRKNLFNNYCRILALEKKSKKETKKPPEEEYQDLLNEMATTKMYWDDFKRKAKNDPRFKAINEIKLREKLFKEHMKKLSQSTSSKTNQSSSSSTSAPASKKRTPEERYRDLLIEKKIQAGMRWRDAKRILEHDDRYHDIESKTLREELFRDYLDELEK